MYTCTCMLPQKLTPSANLRNILVEKILTVGFFYCRVKRLPYSSDHIKITRFEDFHHKMLKFPYFIYLLCSEITLFWHIECISFKIIIHIASFNKMKR